MSILINNNELLVGVQQFMNSIHAKRIYFNGVEVYGYDNVAPAIAITSGTGYSATQTYRLTGTITDTASGIARAYYTHGDSTQHNLTLTRLNSTEATFSVDISLANGTNSITVYAVDNAGNVGSRPLSIVYDNAAHTATLTTALITRLSYGSDGGWDYAHRETRRTTPTDFYVDSYTSSQCSGTGQSVWATASYNGRINISTLPNWQSIKRITITRYGTGAQTFNLNGSLSTVDFTDSSRTTNDEHTVGNYASTTARAGISALTYYYT